MNIRNKPKELSPLEKRLRNEAAAWAEQVQNQPRPTDSASRRRGARRMAAAQWSALACSLLFIVAGAAYWLRPSPAPTQISQAEPAETADEIDLAALQATNVAIQQVFGSAAKNTHRVVDRQLNEVNWLKKRGNAVNSVSLKSQSRDTIRKWALEPGRQYGAAALWFDSRLGQIGESSLSAARRLLNRGTDDSAPNDSSESS
ncbi:MAG: hypothetical protein Aurels2KO_45440 [Aureliella sp.]